MRASSNNLRQEAAGNAANSVDLIRRDAIEHDSFVDKVFHHNSEDFGQVRSAHQLFDDLFARIGHVTSVHDVFVESRQILVELAVVAEAAHFGVNRCKSVKYAATSWPKPQSKQKNRNLSCVFARSQKRQVEAGSDDQSELCVDFLADAREETGDRVVHNCDNFVWKASFRDRVLEELGYV